MGTFKSFFPLRIFPYRKLESFRDFEIFITIELWVRNGLIYNVTTFIRLVTGCYTFWTQFLFLFLKPFSHGSTYCRLPFYVQQKCKDGCHVLTLFLFSWNCWTNILSQRCHLTYCSVRYNLFSILTKGQIIL